MNRKIATALAVLSLALGGLGLAAPALADGKGATAPLRQAGSGALPPVAGPVGPTGITGTVALANGGTVTVPAGYKLYGAAEAKAYLGRIGKTAAPGDVLGMLAPEKADPKARDFWGAVLTWSPIGYVSATGGEQFTQPTFLDAVKAGRGVASPSPDSLTAVPTYAAEPAFLSWGESFKASGPTDRNVRLEGRALARDGFTGVTIHTNPADAATRQKDFAAFAAAISYPTGRKHADYRAGDLASGFDLPGLITGARPTKAVAEAAGEAGPKPQAAVGGGAPAWFPWIGAALIGIPLLLWLIYGRRPRDPPETETIIMAPRPMQTPPAPPPPAAPPVADAKPADPGPTIIAEPPPTEPPRPGGEDPNITPPSR